MALPSEYKVVRKKYFEAISVLISLRISFIGVSLTPIALLSHDLR